MGAGLVSCLQFTQDLVFDLSRAGACSRFIEDRNLPSISSGEKLVLDKLKASFHLR